MVATAYEDRRLAGTDGFVVESPEGDVGYVEEVWVDDANEPRALAVRTVAGRHGLLLGDEVLAVHREARWVVVSPQTVLLELDVPRLVSVRGGSGDAPLSASWTTTGDVLPVSPRAHTGRGPRLRRRPAPAMSSTDPRLPRAIAMLLGSIALLVAVTIALAFVIARLVTGSAY